MKTTEIRFIPKTERPRDLLYCEYSSRARSLHILFRDETVKQHKFLRRAYREIFGSYLSIRDLETPFKFFNTLSQRLETLYEDERLIPADLHGMDFFLLLQEGSRFYVLTSMEKRIHVRLGDFFFCLSNSDTDSVQSFDILKTDSQEELFPRRLQDIFRLYRITPTESGSLEIFAGCSEGERKTLQNAVRDAGTRERPGAWEIPIEFLSRKVLFLHFEDLVSHQKLLEPQDTGKIVKSASFGRVHSSAALLITVVVFIAGAVWVSGYFRPNSPENLTEDGTGNQMEIPLQEPQTAAFEPSPPQPVVEEKTQTAEKNIQPAEIRLETVWKNTYTHPVTSSPAATRQRVFFGCRNGKLYAVDRQSGSLLWSFTASAGIGASPAVREDRVFGADYKGGVFALNTKSGKLSWSRKLPAKVVSSPSVKGNKILVGCFDGFAYCLSSGDGEIIWKRKTGGRLWSTAAASEDRFFIPSYDGNLYALSAGTGEVLWTYNIGGELMGSPAVSGDAVFVGGPDGRVHAIDMRSGKLRWVFRTGGAVKSSIFVSENSVFLGSHDTHLYCLDAANGTLLWKFKTGKRVLTRPCVEGDLVFFGSYDQFFYCLEKRTGKLLDRFKTGGKIYSSPASFEKQLFFGNNAGEFFCLAYTDEKTS